MCYIKEIVCLANSRKHQGRCIAGKEKQGQAFCQWIRPISGRPTTELSETDYRYKDCSDPQVLDIIKVPMIQPMPSNHQTENHLIDEEYYWEKTGQLPWSELQNLIDNPKTLWTNGNSTYYGLNDRVNKSDANKHICSLYLIKPDSLTICVKKEGETFGNPRKRVRAFFSFKMIHYDIVVTDPQAERTFLNKPIGDYPLSDAYLCISLGETHTDDYCYKLAAAVIIKNPL